MSNNSHKFEIVQYYIKNFVFHLHKLFLMYNLGQNFSFSVFRKV